MNVKTADFDRINTGSTPAAVGLDTDMVAGFQLVDKNGFLGVFGVFLGRF